MVFKFSVLDVTFLYKNLLSSYLPLIQQVYGLPVQISI